MKTNKCPTIEIYDKIESWGIFKIYEINYHNFDGKDIIDYIKVDWFKENKGSMSMYLGGDNKFYNSLGNLCGNEIIFD
jgi:hypothetical protein